MHLNTGSTDYIKMGKNVVVLVQVINKEKSYETVIRGLYGYVFMCINVKYWCTFA